MGRSGYTDDCEHLAMWRGQVASAIRGRRGQKFLRALVEALDAMPERRLIAGDLRKGSEVCALGCLGARRGVLLEALDPEDHDALAQVFDVAHQLIQEVMWVNDFNLDTPERRWQCVRDWAVQHINQEVRA